MRIAIIPARGGSKRIPKKNIIEFCGKPMIAHVIAELKATKLFDEIHVSTDSEEIADVARAHGGSVPFLRDPAHATDFAPVLSVIKWVVGKYAEDQKKFETVLMVTPCTPLLEKADFEDACKKFENTDKKNPMLSVARFPSPIEWALADKNGVLVANSPEKMLIRSQDLIPTYYDAGLFCFFGEETLAKDEKVATSFMKYELPRWKAVDIDEVDDLELAKRMFLAMKKNV